MLREFRKKTRNFRRALLKSVGLKHTHISKMRGVQYSSDGLGVSGKNISFMEDHRFVEAWNFAASLNRDGWGGKIPDIRWRAHVAWWAAAHALNLDGDFVECGVHTGLLSLTICRYLDFNKTNKNFWLFDTFAGIPTKDLAPAEIAHVEKLNRDIYFDVFELAKRNFEPFHNANLVRGFLPDTLHSVAVDKVAYLSIDLNNAAGERASIEYLWSKLVPGAVVLLDDYAFAGYELQYETWNDFARNVDRPILTLPTGQGLLIK